MDTFFEMTATESELHLEKPAGFIEKPKGFKKSQSNNDMVA